MGKPVCYHTDTPDSDLDQTDVQAFVSPEQEDYARYSTVYL